MSLEDKLTMRMRRHPSESVRLIGELTFWWRAGRVPLRDFLSLTEEQEGRHVNGKATEAYLAELRTYMAWVTESVGEDAALAESPA